MMVSPSGRRPAAAFVASPTAGLTAHRSAFGGASVAAACRPRVSSVVDRRVWVTAAAAGPATSGRVHVVQPAADVSHLVGGDKTLTRGVEQAPATVGTPALPTPGGGYGIGAVFMALAGAAALFNRKPKKEASGDGVVEPEVVTSMAASANGAAAAGTPERSLGQKLKDMIPTPQERKKLGPLALMFFVILFNYTILRDTKDVLVVTAAGAEVIPFLKTYCNLPGAVLFTVLYSKLNNSLTREQVFYVCIIPFIVFFLAFGFLIYPNTAALHPVAWSAWAAAKLPTSFAPFLAIVRNWTFALFYTLAELWGSVVVSVLFWGFANEVTTVDEAKKYYPLFGLGANVALVFSGQYVRYVSDIRAKLPPGVDGWAVSLKYLMAMIAAGGAVIVGCFYYMQRKIIPDPALFEPRKSKGQSKKKKTQMTLGQSFRFLASSPYIRNMALLVIAYGSAINIVEVSFKSHLKTAFPDPNAYSAFMGNFSSVTGVVTLIMMLVGRWVFRNFGWGVAAAITPVVLGLTGIGFFALTLFAGQAAPIIALAGTTPLMAAVFIGAAQVIMSKACKYSCFDPSKEMLYISLDETSRNEGKAAIDVIGNPLGKSGGSFVQQVLIFATGSLAASTPYLAIILVGIIGMWLAAAKSLDKQFSAFMLKETAAAREKMKASKQVDEPPATAAAGSS